MFFSPIMGQADVTSAIEAIVDPNSATATAWAGVIFGWQSGHGNQVLKMNDYGGEHGMRIQDYRNDLDALLLKYSLAMPYWVGFPRTKNVKDWLNYMQWLGMTISKAYPKAGTFACNFTEYQGDDSEKQLEMVVMMFAKQADLDNFMDVHLNQDYRFDPGIGMKSYRNS